jgi:hypothetical protein
MSRQPPQTQHFPFVSWLQLLTTHQVYQQLVLEALQVEPLLQLRAARLLPLHPGGGMGTCRALGRSCQIMNASTAEGAT